MRAKFGQQSGVQGGVKGQSAALSPEQELICEEAICRSPGADAGTSGESALAMVGPSATDLQAELAGEEELRFNMELYACAILVDSQEANVLCDASTACPCQCGRSGRSASEFWNKILWFTPLPSGYGFGTSLGRGAGSGSHPERSDDRGRRKWLSLPAQGFCLPEGAGRPPLQKRSELLCGSSMPQIQADRVMLEVKLLDGACISAAGGMELRGSLLVHYAMLSTSPPCIMSAPWCWMRLRRTPARNHPPCCGCCGRVKPLGFGKRKYYATVEDILAVNQISDESAAGGRFLLIPRNR